MKLYFHNLGSLPYCNSLSPEVSGNWSLADTTHSLESESSFWEETTSWFLLLAIPIPCVCRRLRETTTSYHHYGTRVKSFVKAYWRTILNFSLLLLIVLCSNEVSEDNNQRKEDALRERNYFPEPKPFLLPSDLDAVQTQMYRQYRCLRPVTHGVEASNTFPVIGPLLRDIGEKHGKRAAYIDIGSNDGQEVALYMKMLHKCSQCHIVSVEPNFKYTPVIQQKVEKRWDVHGPAVTLCRGAVTNERNPHADNEELYLVGEGVFAHIVPKMEAMKKKWKKHRQRVSNVRLSRVIEKLQFDRVVAVKVDTEGYDGTILWSLLGLWSRIRPDFFIYEINAMVTRFPTHPSTLAESFNSIGYKSFVGGLWVDPTQLRMPLSEQQPAMLLFEMTPERWVAVTEAFRFEAGILLPEGGYVLSNFTHITSKSSQEEINILHRILHSRKSGFCRRMEVTEWDVWIHTPWLEMKLEGRLHTPPPIEISENKPIF